MTKREIVIFCKRAFICLLAGTVAGIFLLLAVFLLPTDPMQKHVEASAGQMFSGADEKAGYLQWIEQERETFTDAIILQNAIERAEGKSLFERVMMVYRRDLEEEAWKPEETLQAVCSGADTSEMYLKEYARYWHGYLVYVKPLLLILTWKQLLVFGGVVQIVLLAAVILMSIRKKKAGVGVALITGYVLMKPVLLTASITMSICWILTLSLLIYMLLCNERLVDKAAYSRLFLVAGMLTSYFDLLTYPVMTLGIPLCVYFLLNRGEQVKTECKRAVGYSASWGIGYIGLWGMKWLASDLTLRQGVIKDALWTIIGRTEAIGGRPRWNGAFYSIGLNFQEYDQALYFYLMAAIVVVSLALLGIGCVRFGAVDILKKTVPFALIFFMPFAWITVAQNHSALHARFTFRILAIAFMAISCMGIRSGQKLLENRRNLYRKQKENV